MRIAKSIHQRARPSRTLFSVLYRSTSLRRLSWLPRWARPRLTERKRCHRASLSTDATPDAQTSQRCHSEVQESDAPSASECDPDDPKNVTGFHWGRPRKGDTNSELDQPVPWGQLETHNRPE